MTAEAQRANIVRAAAVLADLVGEGHSIVITHGNGPQVGLLALQAVPDDGRQLFVAGVAGHHFVKAEHRRCGDHGPAVPSLL